MKRLPRGEQQFRSYRRHGIFMPCQASRTSMATGWPRNGTLEAMLVQDTPGRAAASSALRRTPPGPHACPFLKVELLPVRGGQCNVDCLCLLRASDEQPCPDRSAERAPCSASRTTCMRGLRPCPRSDPSRRAPAIPDLA